MMPLTLGATFAAGWLLGRLGPLLARRRARQRRDDIVHSYECLAAVGARFSDRDRENYRAAILATVEK